MNRLDTPLEEDPTPLINTTSEKHGDITNDNVISRIESSNYEEVSQAAFYVLHKMQSKDPDVFVAAWAVGFLLACERFHVPPRRVLQSVTNMMADAKRRFPVHIEALREFMKYEI